MALKNSRTSSENSSHKYPVDPRAGSRQAQHNWQSEPIIPTTTWHNTEVERGWLKEKENEECQGDFKKAGEKEKD